MTFIEQCCGRARGYLPQDGADPALVAARSLSVAVLVCSRCDHTEASVMPREHAARDLRPRP